MGYAGVCGVDGFEDGAVLRADWDDVALGVRAAAHDAAYRADAGDTGEVAVLMVEKS